MIKRSFFLTFCAVVTGGLLVILFQYFFTDPDNTRYVSMSIVFDECNIREKYEKELKVIEEQSNARLAEMENNIRARKTDGSIPADQITAMEQDLLRTRDALSNEYQQKSETFERVIWDKINQKVTEYGKEKGYDYIFGAKGDGSIMYASDEKDITKELITYINQ